MARGEDKQHQIVLFLWGDWLVLIGELRFDCGREAFESAQRACRQLWEQGRAISSPCQGGFAYKILPPTSPTNALSHERRVNGAGRQICCRQCHECGNELRSVLDGELWCDTCGGYR